MIFVLAIIVIANSIIAASNEIVRLAHIINLCVLGFTVFIAWCYHKNFAKRDLLKTDEEEI